MRYTWVSLLVVLLDQLAKWFAPATWPDELAHIGIGGMTLEIIRNPTLTLPNTHAIPSNASSLVLLAALLGIYLLAVRWSDKFHFLTDKTTIGLQLAVGGLTSQAIDITFRGDIVNTLLIKSASHLTLHAGIADIAVISGVLLLVITLLQGNAKVKSQVTLAPANIAPLQLSSLPRGIDNIHIDVHLSPRFRHNLTQLIHALVPIVIHNLQQGKRQFSPPQRQIERIRREFSELMQRALYKAKSHGEIQIPDLLFIATLKFVHGEVNNTVAAALQQSKERKEIHPLRGLKLSSNGHIVEWMFRYRDHIIALTNATLLDALCNKQEAHLKKHIKHLFGLSNLFTTQAMAAPLVLAESASDEMIQMENYIVLGQQQSDRNSFVNIDRKLSESLNDYLELLEESRSGSDTEISYLHGAGGVNSNTIDTLSQPSLLMNPGNIAILLDPAWTERKLNKTQRLRDWRKHNKLRQHLHFQKRLRRKLLSDLLKSELGLWIVATYEAQRLFRQSHCDISVIQLVALLTRKLGKHEFTQKLPESLRGFRRPPEKAAIVEAWERVHKAPRKLLDEYLLRFMHNFSHYRHDLLLLLLYQRAAAEVNLLEEKKDIDTSRANFSLYEFLHKDEEKSTNTPILSHIIIKADLRGSTEITEKLTELELNPATHFDRNFFSPINALIESYGAEKVFIEGDAIILILNEHAGDSQDRLIASRACGLAAKIMQVVARQNATLEAYGLPRLELGIGIAYHDGPPRYLFDNQHRITISPAINRADRLSACNWSVRQWRASQGADERFVEVYLATDEAMTPGEKAQKDLVFNLNGILVEERVFQRINQELTPKRVNNALEKIPESTLYAIHFNSLDNTSHSLILRKAQVHEYHPDYSINACPAVQGRHFHEVIWREELLEKLRKH